MWFTRSHTPGIDWPGIPAPDVGMQLSVLYQLLQSQWWPAEVLRAHQARQLVHLVRHARVHVPYYRERLAGVAAAKSSDAFWQCWRELPILRRRDLQDHADGLISTADLSAQGQEHTEESSGTTGTPVRAKTTGITRMINGAVNLRGYRWRGWDMSGAYACIRFLRGQQADAPEGSTRSYWGPMTGRMFHTGPGHYLDVHAEPAEQVDWLRRRKPDYLSTYPTNLRQLALHCARQGGAPDSIRSAEAISEMLTPDIRRLCRDHLNIRVFGNYSTTEVGCIALECPDHEVYHIQCENVFVEVLNDRGESCLPGERGEVIVTPMNGLKMPLIRYAVGDFAVPGESCACGRGLPVLQQIHGRVQGQVLYPDGTSRMPVLNVSLFTRVAPIRQFQVIQHDLETMEIKLAVEQPLSAEQEAEIRDLLRGDLGHAFDFRFSYSDHIPREPGGKYREFICNVT